MKTKKHILLVIFILLFEFVSAQYTKIFNFDGFLGGKYPYGSLFSDGTFLYGMTRTGGADGIGTIFKIMPDGNNFSKLIDFAGIKNGSFPQGSLISDGTFLYGMTSNGGTNNMGTIFKVMPDGTAYTKLLDFVGPSNGSIPRGDLLLIGTTLYGVTQEGGVNNNGTLFKIMTDGTGYVKLINFADISGIGIPSGSLISDGTFLYGTTDYGVNNLGSLYKTNLNGKGFVKLYEFTTDGLNGNSPSNTLFSDGTFLYGMTKVGGVHNMGTIFKIRTDGTGYIKLLDFDKITNGSYPFGSLISDGTYLYGITAEGGPTDLGIAFKIKPDGTGFETLITFAGASTGEGSLGSLIRDRSFLYGMTTLGGSPYAGTIFKYQLPALNITNYNNNFGLSLYPNPVKNILTIQNPENHPIDKITITDISGKKVLDQKGNSNTINVEKLQQGTYLLQTTSQEKNSVMKFIKN